MHHSISQGASEYNSGPKSNSLHCYSPLRTTLLTEFTLIPALRNLNPCFARFHVPNYHLKHQVGDQPMASRVPTRAMIDVEEPVITPQLGLDLDDLDDFDDIDDLDHRDDP